MVLLGSQEIVPGVHERPKVVSKAEAQEVLEVVLEAAREAMLEEAREVLMEAVLEGT